MIATDVFDALYFILHASVWWRRRWDIILVCAPFSLVVVLLLIQIHSPSLDWGVEISRTTMEREVFQVPTLIFLIEGLICELSRVTRWFSSTGLSCALSRHRYSSAWHNGVAMIHQQPPGDPSLSHHKQR